MAYDVLAESMQLIENGAPTAVAARVSRRIRHVPLAVDVDGRIAATMFLRRGQGQVWRENHVLVRQHGSWRLAGGGGGPGAGPADAPDHQDLGGHLQVEGSGAVYFTESALPRAVHYAALRAARTVQTVLIADRAVRVPRHGWLVAVWPDDRTPHVTALDPAGAVLATADARPPSFRLPPSYPGTR